MKFLKYVAWLFVTVVFTTSVYANTRINILSFNDFHGHVLQDKRTGVPGMAKFVWAVKQAEKRYPNYILVSGGDNYVGPAISNITFGAPVNNMFKELGVSVSAVGNHEFDWGAWRIPLWEKQGNFKYIAANIFSKKTERSVKWTKPYFMVKKAGIKIAFIGLATQETAYTANPNQVKNYFFADDAKLLQKWIDYLLAGKDEMGKPDAIIALTHIPSFQDKFKAPITGDELHNLLNAVHGLDAIITAHSHRFVVGKVDGIPVIQAGCNGKGIGDIALTFSWQHKLIYAKGYLDILSSKLDKLRSV